MVPPLDVLLLAGGLAAVHVFAGKILSLRSVPRSQWLSIGGGVSIAYVFVHLLPEIAERQARIAGGAETANAASAAVQEHLLFVAVLAGFAVFYGLEQFAHRSRRQTSSEEVVGDAETRMAASSFWIHVGSFATYNALVGYLLLRRPETGTRSTLLYATAMGLHFLVNDYGLREHHRDAYEHVGRWILGGAVLAGLAVGYVAAVPELLIGLLLAFLAGGVVLNVIKEELPEERQSRFRAFGAGLVVYTVVLILI